MKPETQSSPTGPNEVSGHACATNADRPPPAPDATLSKSQDFSSARGVRTSASPFVPRASGQHQNATSIAVTPVQSSLPDQAHIRYLSQTLTPSHALFPAAQLHRHRLSFSEAEPYWAVNLEDRNTTSTNGPQSIDSARQLSRSILLQR